MLLSAIHRAANDTLYTYNPLIKLLWAACTCTGEVYPAWPLALVVVSAPTNVITTKFSWCRSVAMRGLHVRSSMMLSSFVGFLSVQGSCRCSFDQAMRNATKHLRSNVGCRSQTRLITRNDSQ
ncbi:hypothetical protein B5807_03882 [Epicoccum nigrum]|jgi:hypothetical protein|uniref:Uncharacterized protein n=1 Tax=Epicoccum nigrum TaxID=105696 RepID=A0A1Y2M6U0_EPING|nr:hypothetical protein B5807_03882 [Epicoccum nigrum]